MLIRTNYNSKLLNDYLRDRIATLREEIHHEPKNRLLNSNEVAYLDYLLQKYTIEPLVCDWEHGKIDEYEKQIPANRLPSDVLFVNGINRNDHRTFPQSTVAYHAPFSGDKSLLDYRPMVSNMSLPEFTVKNDELIFEVSNNMNNAQETKNAIERNICAIRQQIDNINSDLTNHNTAVKTQAQQIFRERKDDLLKRGQLLESIGIPIKRITHDETGEIIPILKKKILIQKPPASNADYVPDPAIDDATYQEILKMCHDLGVAMERRPSLYKDANDKIKCEEFLRDVFLVPLSLQFDSVTGETINNAGKTDILIRYMGKNAFIGECKFWGGPKMHQETINQLLNYLTWRDSKAAIIYFVDNKSLQHVLNQINDLTSQHPCFVKYDGNKEKSWFNYHFHLPKDKSLNVKLAILLFHFN